jgi:hypothetical protein
MLDAFPHAATARWKGHDARTLRACGETGLIDATFRRIRRIARFIEMARVEKAFSTNCAG